MAYEIWETCMLVPGISKSNCSGWVQAWGSVIGLAVAIAVPWRMRVSELLHKQKAENAAASVAGAAMVMPILQIEASLQAIDKALKGRTDPIGASEGREILKRLDAITLPSDSHMLLVANTLPHCIVNLANCCNQINAAKYLLRMCILPNQPSDADITGIINDYHGLADSASARLAKAKGELTVFLQKQGGLLHGA